MYNNKSSNAHCYCGTPTLIQTLPTGLQVMWEWKAEDGSAPFWMPLTDMDLFRIEEVTHTDTCARTPTYTLSYQTPDICCVRTELMVCAFKQRARCASHLNVTVTRLISANIGNALWLLRSVFVIH